jgi:hypothetical protein
VRKREDRALRLLKTTVQTVNAKMRGSLRASSRIYWTCTIRHPSSIPCNAVGKLGLSSVLAVSRITRIVGAKGASHLHRRLVDPLYCGTGDGCFISCGCSRLAAFYNVSLACFALACLHAASPACLSCCELFINSRRPVSLPSRRRQPCRVIFCQTVLSTLDPIQRHSSPTPKLRVGLVLGCRALAGLPGANKVFGFPTLLRHQSQSLASDVQVRTATKDITQLPSLISTS